jgi:quercetin dioxygenase-like cupin family protein
MLEIDRDKLSEIEQKIAESFKKAVRYGQMLQAADNKTYIMETKRGAARMIDVVVTDLIHVTHFYADRDTIVAAHTHKSRETFFVLSGEQHLYRHKQKVILKKGQTYYIESGIPHASFFPVATELMIVFCPPDIID